MSNKYYDLRQTFFRNYFEKGSAFNAYLTSGDPGQQKRWADYYERIKLTAAQETLVAGFTRRLNILVLSGIWCGDCARQGPMFARISERNALIDCRFVESRENPELQDELRIIGAARVPVAVLLSEDFFELSRFGDRQLSAYRRKAANELGPACDAGIVPPSEQELQTELGEWLMNVERAELLLRLAPALRTKYND